VSTVLIDDHILLRVLLGDEPPELRPDRAELATTGLWYHRLCRALSNDTIVGSLSRQLGGVDPAIAGGVARTVVELPEYISLISLRTLAWPMGQLIAEGVRLDLVSLEALAAARHLSAEICLAALDGNAALQAAAPGVSVPVRIL
jgi:hypothetical protein